jgi:hypothetical protein
LSPFPTRDENLSTISARERADRLTAKRRDNVQRQIEAVEAMRRRLACRFPISQPARRVFLDRLAIRAEQRQIAELEALARQPRQLNAVARSPIFFERRRP